MTDPLTLKEVGPVFLSIAEENDFWFDDDGFYRLDMQTGENIKYASINEWVDAILNIFARRVDDAISKTLDTEGE